jgi:hypothetical protein
MENITMRIRTTFEQITLHEIQWRAQPFSQEYWFSFRPGWIAHGLVLLLLAALTGPVAAQSPVTGKIHTPQVSTMVNPRALIATQTSLPNYLRFSQQAPDAKFKSQSVSIDPIAKQQPRALTASPYSNPLASPAPSASFQAFPGCCSFPPNEQGAVGHEHLLVTNNSSFIRIQDKSGKQVIPDISGHAFWQPVGVPGSDPRAIYDPFARRWIMVMRSADASVPATAALLLAVSQGADPTGYWHLHRIKADPRSISAVDFPKLGFNSKWLVITASIIPMGEGHVPSPQDNVYVFDKTALYAGLAQYQLFEEPSLYPASTPVMTYDNDQPNLYIVQTWNNNHQGMGVLRVSTIFDHDGSASLTLGTAFPSTPNPWSPFTLTAPQLGSAVRLRPDSFHVSSAVMRNGYLWCTHSVALPADGWPTHTAIQWWQIRPTGEVFQQGRIDDASGLQSYDYASVAVNKNSDVLIGYSMFSDSIYPSAGYSLRKATDAKETIRTPALLKAGTGPYGFARWGDYSSTVIDPANDLDMWTLQQYSDTGGTDSSLTGWALWWGKVSPGPNAGVCLRKKTATFARGTTVTKTRNIATKRLK